MVLGGVVLPGWVSLGAVAGAGGDPMAGDAPGRGQRGSITLGRAAGAGQHHSVPEPRPGLPGVHCDQGAQIQSLPRNRYRDIQPVTQHKFLHCGEGETPVPWVLISATTSCLFFPCRLVCTFLLTESIYPAEQGCKRKKKKACV